MINESFDKILDSSIVDYSSEFEKNDKKIFIDKWLNDHLAFYNNYKKINGISINTNTSEVKISSIDNDLQLRIDEEDKNIPCIFDFEEDTISIHIGGDGILRNFDFIKDFDKKIIKYIWINSNIKFIPNKELPNVKINTSSYDGINFINLNNISFFKNVDFINLYSNSEKRKPESFEYDEDLGDYFGVIEINGTTNNACTYKELFKSVLENINSSYIDNEKYILIRFSYGNDRKRGYSRTSFISDAALFNINGTKVLKCTNRKNYSDDQPSYILENGEIKEVILDLKNKTIEDYIRPQYPLDRMLGESFNNILDSSIVDYSSEFEKNEKIDKIKRWIEGSTSTWKSGQYLRLKYGTDYKINDDFSIDTFCNITIESPDRWYGVDDKISKNTKYPTELPEYINFNIANGDFVVHQGGDIRSLRGFPKEVYGSFYIWEQSLKSLEGGPTIVTGNYNAYGNKLESLVGAPKVIGDPKNQWRSVFFNVSSNKLKNLIGGPETVYGDYRVESNQLESLDGCPMNVFGTFDLKFNKKLLSLPKEIFTEAYIDNFDFSKQQRELWFGETKSKSKKGKKIEESFSNILDSSIVDYSSEFEKNDINTRKNKILSWCKNHVFKYNEINPDNGEGIYSNIPASIEILDDFTINVNDNIYFDYFKSEDFDEFGNIELPNYIQFNTIKGSIHSSGDLWKTFKGFPKRIEGILYLGYNGSLRSYEYFPKEVHGFEIEDYELEPKYLIKYLPEIIKEDHNGDPSYIKIYNDSLSKIESRKLYKDLLDKYVSSKIIDSIEVPYFYTGHNGWGLDINESFNNVLDSSIIDYTSEFETDDKRLQIENWIEYHVFDQIPNQKYFDEYGDLIKVKKDHSYTYKIHSDYSISINGDIFVILDPDIHELPYKFTEVSGNFVILYPGSNYSNDIKLKYQLRSLKNTPYWVAGDFAITGSRLDDLTGCPMYIGGDLKAFDCSLKSIKGISNIIRGDIFLSRNDIQDSQAEFETYLKDYLKNLYKGSFSANIFLNGNNIKWFGNDSPFNIYYKN